MLTERLCQHNPMHRRSRLLPSGAFSCRIVRPMTHRVQAGVCWCDQELICAALLPKLHPKAHDLGGGLPARAGSGDAAVDRAGVLLFKHFG